MKQTIKTTVMVLVAMFAFSTVADAQFGKLKSLVGGKSKKEKQDEKMKEMQQQMQADYKAKQKADNDAYISKLKAEKEKVWDLYSWKEGKVVQGHNHFYGDTEPISKTKLYSWEENFRDKEMKKKIAEAFMDYEKFENRKRNEKFFYKDRKVVAVMFNRTDWKILRDKWDAITGREMYIKVVSELTDGFTMADTYKVSSPYTGSGNYSENFEFELDTKYRWMITDWEHNPNADPLADL